MAGDGEKTAADAAKTQASSAIDEALNFLKNPALGKGITDITDIMNNEGLTQSQKDDMVKALEEKDKARQVELEALQKKLDDNKKKIEGDEELITKSQQAADQLKKEIDEIAARRKDRQVEIDKLTAEAAAAHGDAATLEEQLKKLHEENEQKKKDQGF